KDFYYTTTTYFNGSNDIEAVSDSSSDDSENSTSSAENENPVGDKNFAPNDMGNMGGPKGMSMNMGDFTVVGYSSDIAMTDFKDGTSTIVEGAVFEEGTKEYQCVISQELATYNELSVGDKITLTNPNNEDEKYKLEVVGVYEKASEQGDMSSRFGFTMSDPANEIYLSYNAVSDLIDKSEKSNEDDTSSALRESMNATYTFSDVDDYEVFCEEVYELGLDENYTVSSSDITAFENSMVPLETLSTTAGYFLLVILLIGGVILVVLNIFNVRERKYEIGVLTAMGMKKWKVALQFLTEVFIVTMCAVIIGVIVGGVSALPVTNALLENQNNAQLSQADEFSENFGRDNAFMDGEAPPDMGMGPDDKGFENSDGKGFMKNVPGAQAMNDYVTEINSAMNLTVVFQMLIIAIVLTLISGAVSMLFVMRYEPLKILSNRD
ncbi:MAG: ABC transporter permease, partial [Ruminococcus sp.]|nr:ABC transporter permease [Ruminococcus sp.]